MVYRCVVWSGVIATAFYAICVSRDLQMVADSLRKNRLKSVVAIGAGEGAVPVPAPVPAPRGWNRPLREYEWTKSKTLVQMFVLGESFAASAVLTVTVVVPLVEGFAPAYGEHVVYLLLLMLVTRSFVAAEKDSNFTSAVVMAMG